MIYSTCLGKRKNKQRPKEKNLVVTLLHVIASNQNSRDPGLTSSRNAFKRILVIHDLV